MAAFIIQMWQLEMMILLGVIMGFGVAFFLKYPKLRLTWLFFKMLNKKPVIYCEISTRNKFTPKIVPEAEFIRDFKMDNNKVFFPLGETVNMFGFGEGHIFYEESNVPLKISAVSLREKIVNKCEELSVDFSLMSSKQLGNLCVTATQMAYQVGMAKQQKKNQLMTYVGLGLGALTLVLVIVGVFETSQVAMATKGIVHYLTAAGHETVKGGVQYGIKK